MGAGRNCKGAKGTRTSVRFPRTGSPYGLTHTYAAQAGELAGETLGGLVCGPPFLRSSVEPNRAVSNSFC